MPNDTQQETLTIRFEKSDPGDHSANADAVASAMHAVTTLVNHVHSECDKNKQFLVKARPFGRGSLEVPLDLILFVGGMLLPEAPFFGKVREILKQFLDLKGKLGGKSFSVTDGNIIVLENTSVQADSLTIQMLDPSSDESRLFEQTFTAAEKDGQVTSLRISSSRTNQPVVEVPRRRFARFRQPVSEQDLTIPRQVASSEVVTIRALAFDPQLSWHFRWGGRAITAKVIAPDFMERVQSSRETFRNGDQLRVKLNRLQRYDPETRTHVDREFTVTEVYEHIGRQETGQFLDT